jgi:hypothetical protein
VERPRVIEFVGRRARHIGDFSQWKNHDDYQRTLQRVLRDLTTPK